MMGYGRGYGYGGGMMGGWGGLVFAFFGLLVLVAIVLLVVWAIRTTQGSGHKQPPAAGSADEACAIARARYAKGEITKEQYEEMCRTLGV
jgi:putative membrane protein